MAALGALLAWAAKAVVIWTADGLGESPAETPLFLVGLMCTLTAVVALALAASRRRSGAMRVVFPLAWIIAVVVSGLVDWSVTLPEPAEDPSWVWAEMELWSVAVTLLGAAVLQRTLTDGRAVSHERVQAPGGASNAIYVVLGLAVAVLVLKRVRKRRGPEGEVAGGPLTTLRGWPPNPPGSPSSSTATTPRPPSSRRCSPRSRSTAAPP